MYSALRKLAALLAMALIPACGPSDSSGTPPPPPPPPPPPATGALDVAFDGDGIVTTGIGPGNDSVSAVAVQSDEKIVVAGRASNGTNDDFALARYNADGSLDTTFDGDGKLTIPIGTGDETAMPIAIQSDGRIVVAGWAHTGVAPDFAVIRIEPDGTLDTTFDTDGVVTTAVGPGGDYGNAVAIQTDGKIVVAGDASNGSNADVALVRYNADGSLDTTFDTDGKVMTPIGISTDFAAAVAIQPDGRIIVAGGSYTGVYSDFALVRYDPDGSLDISFDGDGIVVTPLTAEYDDASAVALQPDGKIVASGRAIASFNADFAVVRYNADGSLDTSFDTDGKVITPVGAGADESYGLRVQADGDLVVAGSSHNGANTDFAVVRYKPDGSLDMAFDTDGKVTTPIGTSVEQALDVAIQADGKIVLAGDTLLGTTTDFAVVRYE